MGKFRSPITGYNHNVRHRGWVFHVQTEDSGVQNPHIFTHCFNGGVIVNTKKMIYDAVADTDVVKGLMQAQHKSVLRELKKGDYDEKIDRYLGASPEEGDDGAPDERPITVPPVEVPVADEVPPTERIAIHADAPEEDTDSVPEPLEGDLTASTTDRQVMIEADAPEGLEQRVAGLPAMPAVEAGRWQIREPAADEVPPPVAAEAVPKSTWVVRAGGYQESPFEQSRPYAAQPEPERQAMRAPLTQPRQVHDYVQSPVTFSSPREGTDAHARVLAERAAPPPGEPPSGAFTINNRARRSISADMMDPAEGPLPNASRSGLAPTQAPWENTPHPAGPGWADARTGSQQPPAAVRPQAPGRTPPEQNVIVSRPVVLGQREARNTHGPAVPPNAVRIQPRTIPPHEPAPSAVVSEKSLDEVILAYLSEEQKK